mmetsp:Transcript_19535/g.74980  ORF Transcript_19535/g.74980 Transcript_19535/m.74980 type:complete len:222 (-) Transcript_19535:2783-3448(-)
MGSCCWPGTSQGPRRAAAASSSCRRCCWREASILCCSSASAWLRSSSMPRSCALFSSHVSATLRSCCPMGACGIGRCGRGTSGAGLWRGGGCSGCGCCPWPAGSSRRPWETEGGASSRRKERTAMRGTTTLDTSAAWSTTCMEARVTSLALRMRAPGRRKEAMSMGRAGPGGPPWERWERRRRATFSSADVGWKENTSTPSSSCSPSARARGATEQPAAAH